MSCVTKGKNKKEKDMKKKWFNNNHNMGCEGETSSHNL
jgi:hypothetical protein